MKLADGQSYTVNRNEGNEVKFACVDGPEFDASLIDFDEAMRRQRMYKSKESVADHRCRIGRG